MARKATRAAALAALLCVAAEARAAASSSPRRQNLPCGGGSSRASSPARRARAASLTRPSYSAAFVVSAPSTSSTTAFSASRKNNAAIFSLRGGGAFLDARPSSVVRPRKVPSLSAGAAAKAAYRPRLRPPTRRTSRLYDREDTDGDGSGNGNGSGNGGGDEPLPAWVESLLNWNLQPTLPNLMRMPPPTVEEEREALQEARSETSTKPDASDDDTDGERPRTYPDDFPAGGGIVAGSGAQVPAPLASLINVEALLLASGGDVLDADARGLDLKPVSGSVVTSGVSDGADKAANASKIGDAGAGAFGPQPLAILPNLEELGDFDRLVRTLKSSIDPFVEEALSGKPTTASEAAAASAAEAEIGAASPPTPESVLRSTTSRIASFLDETSRTLNTAAVQDLVVRASNALAIEQSATGIRAAADEVVRVAERLARERGLDVTAAAEAARETTRYTEELLRVANGVLVSGYVQGDGRGAAGAARITAEEEEERRRKIRVEDGMFGGDGIDDDDAASSPTDALYSKPLFDDFVTATAVPSDPLSSDRRRTIVKAAEMARLAAAIYGDILEETRTAGHSMVNNGVTGDVAWMVTDSLGYEEDFADGASRGNGDDDADEESRTPIMIRTVTIRGFDASDEEVDRERLLNRICTASPVPIGGGGGSDGNGSSSASSSSDSSKVLVHAGLLSIARKLYNEIAEYVDGAAPNHRIVLNGHSIGGSLNVLMLLLMAEKRGSDFVKDKILRVFTFGSPPVAVYVGENDEEQTQNGVTNGGKAADIISCAVLSSFSLPVDLVYGYVQPWDPIVRLFSSVDPLYPLVEDVGEDGITLYASGPNRALRPITRSIIVSWDGWSKFRDNILDHTPDPSFESVGVQHVLLPEPTRYLTDRLVGANLAVPPIDTVVRISSAELLPALVKTYPLDVFGISFVPAALRSFVHHFYPAYVDSFVEYAEGGGDERKGDDGANEERESSAASMKKPLGDETTNGIVRDDGASPAGDRPRSSAAPGGGGGSDSVVADQRIVRERRGIVDWASASAQWVLGGNKVLGDDPVDGEDKL